MYQKRYFHSLQTLLYYSQGGVVFELVRRYEKRSQIGLREVQRI